MNWHRIVQEVAPHVVKVRTPQGVGTGFLVHRDGNSAGVITAEHVIHEAITWEQNIVIEHPAFSNLWTLRKDSRIYLNHGKLDSAYLEGELPEFISGKDFPKKPIETVSDDLFVRIGVEVGWLGFPNIVSAKEPSFFSGHISRYAKGRYFIDGVGIPGVSGGPAFHFSEVFEKTIILGSISSYRTAYLGTEVIPGLMVVDQCGYWSKILESEEHN